MTTVRFFADDKVVGHGVFLDSGEVITAAHVLNAVAGVSLLNSATRVGEKYTVDFPLVEGEKRKFSAKVVRWLKPKRGDIATLELAETPKARGAILDPFVPLESGQPVHVWGFGAFAEGKVVSPTAGNRWQIDQAPNPNHPIIEGFSGSPVLDSENRILGIIWGGREGRRDTQMIPATLLDERRFVHETHRGTPNWHLSFIVEHLLTAIFNDLVNLEARGLHPEECAIVTSAFARLNNLLSEMDDAGWVQPPHQISERMEMAYREWNEWKFGPDGAEKRNTSVRSLRGVRGELNAGTRRYKSTLYQERLASLAERVVRNFEPVVGIRDELNQTRFRNLQHAIGEYRKRARGAGPLSREMARQ